MWWQVELEHTLNHLRYANKPSRVAIVGVGHEFCGDDAAGILLVRKLKRYKLNEPRLLVIEADQSPENFCGVLREFLPDLVMIVDAAWMGKEPGTVRWLSWQEAEGTGILTHGLPIKVFSNYIATELSCEIGLLGIQPACTTFFAPLSAEMQLAIENTTTELMDLLEGWIQPVLRLECKIN